MTLSNTQPKRGLEKLFQEIQSREGEQPRRRSRPGDEREQSGSLSFVTKGPVTSTGPLMEGIGVYDYLDVPGAAVLRGCNPFQNGMCPLEMLSITLSA